jgi:hypothetical protein
MVRVAARSIAAKMKYMQSVWNIAFVMRNPGNFMRFKMILLPRNSESELSISKSVFAGHPEPALIRSCNLYLGPKSFLNRFRQELLKHFGCDRFCTHSVSQLIVCHAPGLVIAGALLF